MKPIPYKEDRYLMSDLAYVIDKLKTRQTLTGTELVSLISSTDESIWQKVYAVADQIRQEYVGDDVHLRGLLEFSNICKRNCSYCGLRKNNRDQIRYRMQPSDIIEQAQRIASYGIKTVVLQSGEDAFYSLDMLTHIIRSIKQTADIAITLSIGERTKDDYRTLREAGADRYLLRHETASKELYEKLHPDSKYEERIRCIEDLFDVGFQVGIGSMVGLPGQTAGDLAEDILLIQKYQPDMIGIGPFIPHQDTPIGQADSGTIEDTLKIVSLARIVCPTAHIPATTATGTIDYYGREKALHAGANVVMPNFTPQSYRVHYNIYPNKRCIDEEGHKCNFCIRAMIVREGRTVGTGYGHAIRFKHNTG